ncbi:MAG: hypothetical protein SF162_08685 [bacterium]|nr:hypothetical protein [bacterium]
MRVQRRTNLVAGLVVLAGIGFILANAAGYVPAGLLDLVNRALPALLIFAGIGFILRDRVPLSGLIALAISLAAVGAIAATAYNGRAIRLSNDTQQAIAQPVSDTIALLRVSVTTLGTDVELFTGLSRADGLNGDFAGAAANLIEVSYTENTDDTADLVVRETQTSGFPGLNDVGRGTFQLGLPPDVPLDVQITGRDGTVTLNMSGLSLERLNVNAGRGDVVITLPEYDPLFSQPDDLLGDIAVLNGDLALFVPGSVSARLELTGGGGSPEYDPNAYNLLASGVLEARGIDTAPIVVRYTLNVPRGRVRLQVPG